MDYNKRLKSYILPKIRDRAVFSIKKNFRVGGRPKKWKPSHRSKSIHKSSFDKRKRHGKTLIDTATLLNSIKGKIKDNHVEIGTSVTYAKIHNFGGIISGKFRVRSHQRKTPSGKTTTVKEHTRNVKFKIPKREFMILQKQDLKYFKDVIKRGLSK
jgi:phage gpG-like protein